ncbi:uncharacterized protein N7515_002036 [Penicillium bovifimosum]|uniref:Uncharacterized protein n=1 Tax=Penicillium bovifimosum TaxID=126998 RepID=A0A9W9L9A2_9EURO|nr:uncharacterized protein N7515_002036 [Penicillium bovifimosum]KAJ5143249.1 hypothetical protein N7515_002036 [Penicillium bovifimosum]
MADLLQANADERAVHLERYGLSMHRLRPLQTAPGMSPDAAVASTHASSTHHALWGLTDASQHQTVIFSENTSVLIGDDTSQSPRTSDTGPGLILAIGLAKSSRLGLLMLQCEG